MTDRPPDAVASELLERCTFPPAGTPVTCAVSGGADSVALLLLAVEAGCVATAVHVDHGLRAGSEAEAVAVAAIADELGAGFRAERVLVEPGPNLEARAREARHGVLPDALFGHTADDQAETMLLNLMRGAGVDGLAAMSTERHPLLGLRRFETRELCRQRGVSTFEDPSNTDPAFTRNRVRHELLPLLDDIARRDVVEVLARQAAVFGEVAGFLSDRAAALDPTDAAALVEAPPPLARVALRRWIRDTTGSAHPCDEASIRRVLDVASGRRRATEVSGGWRVARTARRMRLEPPADFAG